MPPAFAVGIGANILNLLCVGVAGRAATPPRGLCLNGATLLAHAAMAFVAGDQWLRGGMR